MNNNAVGQFAQLDNGERVLVEIVGLPDGNIPARAVYRYIEGENAGHRGSCWVHNLELLGYEIPKQATSTMP
jgi:hypothetical protein